MFIVLIIYKFIGAINIPRLPEPERSVVRVKFSRQKRNGAKEEAGTSLSLTALLFPRTQGAVTAETER